MGNRASRDRTDQRVVVMMLGVGMVVGLAFPFVARSLVEPRSTVAEAAFWLLCVGAGLGVGAVGAVLVKRTGESLMREILTHSAQEFDLQVRAVGSVHEMKSELVGLMERLHSLLTSARAINNDMRSLTAQVLAATEEQASGAAQQAAAVTETSATVEELAQTSKQIAENSSAVVAVAERTLASAEEGMQAVADTADGIEEIRSSTQQASDRILALGERSQEIGRVLVIIDDIAEQTKILALNAAIEAARAGEAGKGFAVVAEEIRKLADSVTESTQEIGRVVREIQASTSQLIMSTERAAKKVDEGKELATRTADALDRIVHQVEETTDAAKQISIATQQQRTASEQVVLSMREVAQVSQQAAETSRQISAAITDLNRLADNLLTS